MLPTSRCFAGRIITRAERVDGLVWDQPCLIPTELMLPTDPPMYFCVGHGESIYEQLYEVFEAQGLIDYDIAAEPWTAFRDLMDHLGPLEGQ
jgi:hypothetical protein